MLAVQGSFRRVGGFHFFWTAFRIMIYHAFRPNGHPGVEQSLPWKDKFGLPRTCSEPVAASAPIGKG